MRLPALLFCALMPLPAVADLPVAVALAIKDCLTDGPDLDAREATFVAAGWLRARDDSLAIAITALAPVMLIRTGQPPVEATPAEAADLLQRAVDAQQLVARRDSPGQRWFVLPGADAYLSLQSRTGRDASCGLAVAVDPGELADLFGVAIATREVPPLTIHSIQTGAGRGSEPEVLIFAPGTFAANQPLPQVYLPPARVEAPTP